MRKLLDSSALTGVSHVFDMDEVTDEARIVAVQDASPITEANRTEFNEMAGRRFGDGMEKVASIPMTIYYDLKKKGVIDDPVAMKKWLNDPDNRFFRTRPGAV